MIATEASKMLIFTVKNYDFTQNFQKKDPDSIHYNNDVRLQMHCIFARPPHLVESSGTSMMSPCLKRYNNKAS
jgi:hypothetical protein